MTDYVFILMIIVFHLYENESASIYYQRHKRGLLSRSGICPAPVINYIVKDTRLNFYGQQYFLPGDASPPCSLSECHYDSDCRGDRKCCFNHCGAKICTEAERDPHPCDNFQCPITKVCKVQRVRCIDPVCPDMEAVARPICVNGGPLYQMGKRSRIPRPVLRNMREQSSFRPQEVSWIPKKPYYDSKYVYYGATEFK